VIDRPGPWGTGPFILADGHSSLDHEQLVLAKDPFACTWLWSEDRTPEVRLVANRGYWNRRRGPRVEEVVFRNDMPAETALDLVCTTDGEVDILTELDPAHAARVERSTHARLVETSGMRVVAGVIDRHAEGLPLGDRRARQALNLAIDRAALVREAAFGRGRPLAGLTPPTALTAAHRLPDRLAPYPHDPERAAGLWRAATGGARTRALRIAALEPLGRAAAGVAAGLEAVLGLPVETSLIGRHDALVDLARRDRPHEWDLLITQHVPQSADAPPHELHRGFAGADGEYRAGPVLPEFERLYDDLLRQTAPRNLIRASNRIDAFVRREALALFLYAPSALYAVNRHVDFRPYRTSFELAETSVGPEHWSRVR